MTPIFHLWSDKEDITKSILPQFLSLTLTDNADSQADTLSITLADTAKATIIPEPETVLSLAMGYSGHPLRNMGKFVMDEVEWSDPPPKLVLSARTSGQSETKGAFPAPVLTKKSRSWDAGTKLVDMVSKIASEHNLKAKVGDSLIGIILPHLDQTDETDANFICRIAEPYGAFGKITNGTLCVVTPEDVKLAAKAVPPTEAPAPFIIEPGTYTSLRWKNKKRQQYKRVVAIWRDKAAATNREVFAGDPDAKAPTDRLRTTYPDELTALAAARSRLEEILREGSSLDITLPAPPDMSPSADSPIQVRNIAPQIDGQWMPKTVTWNLSRGGGLSISISCDADK